MKKYEQHHNRSLIEVTDKKYDESKPDLIWFCFFLLLYSVWNISGFAMKKTNKNDFILYKFFEFGNYAIPIFAIVHPYVIYVCKHGYTPR